MGIGSASGSSSVNHTILGEGGRDEGAGHDHERDVDWQGPFMSLLPRRVNKGKKLLLFVSGRSPMGERGVLRLLAITVSFL